MWASLGYLGFNGKSRDCSRPFLQIQTSLQIQSSGRPLLGQNGKCFKQDSLLQMTDPYSDPSKVIQLLPRVYPPINPLRTLLAPVSVSPCLSASFSQASVPTRLEPRAALGSNPTLERKMNHSHQLQIEKLQGRILGPMCVSGPITAAR